MIDERVYTLSTSFINFDVLASVGIKHISGPGDIFVKFGSSAEYLLVEGEFRFTSGPDGRPFENIQMRASVAGDYRLAFASDRQKDKFSNTAGAAATENLQGQRFGGLADIIIAGVTLASVDPSTLMPAGDTAIAVIVSLDPTAAGPVKWTMTGTASAIWGIWLNPGETQSVSFNGAVGSTLDIFNPNAGPVNVFRAVLSRP